MVIVLKWPTLNIGISMMHGLVVGLGLILLYGLGAKYLPSGELVMLSLLRGCFGYFLGMASNIWASTRSRVVIL